MSSLSYTFKRLVRSWRLFIALLLGIVLASTFFAGINVGADTAAKQALDQELGKVLVDVVVGPGYEYLTSTMGLLSSENVTAAMTAISRIDGVDKIEVISGGWYTSQISDKNLTISYFRLIGISENSRVRDGWIGGAPQTIGENETYVWAGSEDAERLQVGDIIPLNFTMGRLSFLLNLKVAGFAQLSDKALSIANGVYQYYDAGGGYYPNLLISSWEETFARLLDSVYDFSPAYSNPIGTQILVYINRAQLISPWDIAGSISRLDDVTVKINSAVSKYNLQASNQLRSTLNNYQGKSLGMRFTFIIAALPVFFVAWYMGSTVSDVSFNLRRREIGLLMTKGFSRRQLFWMFLLETALIGLLGGVLGIVLSLTLSPWFVAAAGGQFIGVPVIGPDSIVLTLAFALIITFLSAYRPARRASSMATVDALREYMYVEEVKPYKRLWPWVAFILGAFKIVVFLLGINFQAEMTRLGPPSNILVSFLLTIVVILDGVLTIIGPFLFFWGFTKIFIRGSLKFQEVTARAAKFLGDLGELATKSVQRNPARAAAVAFLIAFIIGYSVQIVGILASEQDFGTRETYFTVGADVSVALSSPTNASQVMDTIVSNVSHIQSATVEYTFWGAVGLGAYGESVQLRAVDPDTWLSVAHYENALFSGKPVEEAFRAMSLNNRTIILELNYAKALNKGVGDVVAVTFTAPGQQKTEELTVVGFFGIESPPTQSQIQQFSFSTRYWSYVPQGLYNDLREDVIDYSSARILVKLESGADGEAVADQIHGLPISFSSVSSVAEQLRKLQSSSSVTGPLNILRLGVFFIVVAASVGTALVTLVSLRERKREASIMSVRGLSFRQLLVMLLTENLSVVIFAVLLGAVVGLIVVHGIVASWNTMAAVSYSYTPLSRRMVFPPDALLTLLISFTLVFASTIIPVIFMAKIYSSRLERTVREV